MLGSVAIPAPAIVRLSGFANPTLHTTWNMEVVIVAERILLFAFALLCFYLSERERAPFSGAKEYAYRLISASLYALGMICIQEASGFASMKYHSLPELFTS